MSKNYSDLNTEQKFLEFTLEILCSCATSEGFPEAKEALGRLSQLVEKENFPESVEVKFHQATEIFNNMLKLYENTEFNMFSSPGGEFSKMMTQIRDLLMEAHEAIS